MGETRGTPVNGRKGVEVGRVRSLRVERVGTCRRVNLEALNLHLNWRNGKRRCREEVFGNLSIQ